jgi:hypothetical protein
MGRGSFIGRIGNCAVIPNRNFKEGILFVFTKAQPVLSHKSPRFPASAIQGVQKRSLVIDSIPGLSIFQIVGNGRVDIFFDLPRRQIFHDCLFFFLEEGYPVLIKLFVVTPVGSGRIKSIPEVYKKMVLYGKPVDLPVDQGNPIILIGVVYHHLFSYQVVLQQEIFIQDPVIVHGSFPHMGIVEKRIPVSEYKAILCIFAPPVKSRFRYEVTVINLKSIVISVRGNQAVFPGRLGPAPQAEAAEKQNARISEDG